MAFGKEVDPSVGANTQFKPGVSGNPAGKPAGIKHISTHIQDMLNDEDFSMLLPDRREGYKEHKGAPLKAIIKVAIIRAAQGEKESREWVAKYGYGVTANVNNSGEQKIIIETRKGSARDSN